LLILDLMLPDLDGVEVLRRLRENQATAALPVIVLSARAQVQDKVKALQAGADEYLTKPIEADEMVERVKGLLSRRKVLARASARKPGRVLAFIGAKGGVGTTTVALNVAAALHRQKIDVIATEIRGSFGGFATQMQLPAPTNLSHLLDLEAQSIGARELESCLLKSSFGFRVLQGPQRVDDFRVVTRGHAQAIVSALSEMADYLVLDLPCAADEATQIAAEKSAFVALVLEREDGAIAQATMALQLLHRWGISGARVGAVLVGHGHLMNTPGLADIRAKLACQIVGLVPAAPEAHQRALRGRVALIDPARDNLAASSLVEMAARLALDPVVPLSA